MPPSNSDLQQRHASADLQRRSPESSPSLCGDTRLLCVQGRGLRPLYSGAPALPRSWPMAWATTGEVRGRLATGVCRLRHDRMEQGPTEPHAGRSTFLLSSGGAGGGYY